MAQNEPSRSDLDVSRRGALCALYVRVATTLDRSADLAEQHAARLTRQGKHDQAREELERAEQVRAAARRGRELAAQMK